MNPAKRGRVLRPLRRRGRSVARLDLLIAADPLGAAVAAYPDLAQACADLELRYYLARSFPGGRNERSLADAFDTVEAAIGALTKDEVAAARSWLTGTGKLPQGGLKSDKEFLAAVRGQVRRKYPAEQIVADSARRLKPAKLNPPRVKVPKVQLPGVAGPGGHDLLQRFADADAAVFRAVSEFNTACSHEPVKTIIERGEALIVVLTKKRRLKRSKVPLGPDDLLLRTDDLAKMRDAVRSTYRQFADELVTAEGLAVVEAFHRGLTKLDPNDAAIDAWARLRPLISHDDLEAIATVAARMEKIDALAAKGIDDMINGWVNVLQGLLGELVGRKGVYRSVYERNLRRAHAFVEGPNGGSWRVSLQQVPVQALKENGSFGLFYDDVICLVDDTNDKVAIVFSGQMKMGRSASREIPVQYASDEVRAGFKKVLLNGRIYDMVDDVIEHRSAIVSSIAPPTSFWRSLPVERAAPGRDPRVMFLAMPGDPEDVRTLLRFMLEASGRAPSR